MIKIGPLENIVDEKVISYKYTPVDHERKLSANIVLYFESGKKLFISSAVSAQGLKGPSILFMGPTDENIEEPGTS